MSTVIGKSGPGNTLEQQYCHSTRNMSLKQIGRVENLSDELLGESEHLHLARELYKKIQDQKNVDLYFQ